MAEKILVPLDGSEKASEALRYAIEKHPDAEITVLHALELMGSDVADGAVITMDEQIENAAEKRSEQIFGEATELAADLGYDDDLSTIVETGAPEEVIVEHSTDFDSIVMGSYGAEGVGQKLLGSVAETVVRRSTVPVTVVK